jgi:hypothetical protein
MAENGKGRLDKLISMLPESMTKISARRIKSSQERQRRAIEEQTEGRESDGRNGSDAGEMGKPWDDTFKKNE